jgi:NAD(P)-dependent dehydrogenase (short-subunit alcohol dehydrogenase family)
MTASATQRVLVMTGATSGIGAQALARIAAQPAISGFVGARRAPTATPPGVEVLPLDLASLASVREFAETVALRLPEGGIDMLVLNAGTQFSTTERRSADDFEMTFAVNHLAHYLLARLLLPATAEGGRIILTTSDTHDPKIIGMAPRELDIDGWAHPRPGGGGRAYPASKLCNLLTARSLASLDEVTARHITVIAFNPGLTGGTSLGRESPTAAKVMHAARPILWVVGLFRSQFHMHTPKQAGEALSQLALGTATPPPGHIYASLVRGQLTYPDPSELAQSDEARDRLWNESAAMVNLV